MYGRSARAAKKKKGGSNNEVTVLRKWPWDGFHCQDTKFICLLTPLAPTKIREEKFNLKKLHLFKIIWLLENVILEKHI